MGGSCGRYGGQEMCIQNFGGNGREEDHFEDLFLHGRIILKWIFKKWDGEAWIYLAQVAGACECGNEFDFCLTVHHQLGKVI